jgi:hypothetical protein
MNRSRFGGVGAGGGSGATTFGGLLDAGSVDLPAANAPLAAALNALDLAVDNAATAAAAAAAPDTAPELAATIGGATTEQKTALIAALGAATQPGAILAKSASATLAFSELGHNRTVLSQGAGPHTYTLGTDFPADADVVILPESNLAATFAVVAGAGHTIYVPPDCSVASATAQGGAVSLRYRGANTWHCTSPARVEAGSGGTPTSRTLLAATAVAAAGTATAVASTAPKTVECKVAATGSGSIVARFDVFASFDAGATYTRIDTLFVTGADAAGAQRSIVFNAQFTHIRVDLVSLETTGVTAATATALGIW